MVHLTNLTALNVRALREVFAVDVQRERLRLSKTTATWVGSADVALKEVEDAIARLPGRSHPKASLHAVRRKLVKEAMR